MGVIKGMVVVVNSFPRFCFGNELRINEVFAQSIAYSSILCSGASYARNMQLTIVDLLFDDFAVSRPLPTPIPIIMLIRS